MSQASDESLFAQGLPHSATPFNCARDAIKTTDEREESSHPRHERAQADDGQIIAFNNPFNK